jgi:hypothetical protein
LGPTVFIINASDLHPISKINHFSKYADDVILLVPGSNSPTIPAELTHLSCWAAGNNLSLNPSKTHELIVRRKNCKSINLPPPCSALARVSTLCILGVTFDENLDFREHINNTVIKGGQCLYALKTLKAHGLSFGAMRSVCMATLVSRLSYAASAWSGYARLEDTTRLQAVLNKAERWGLNGGIPLPKFIDTCDKADVKLFASIQNCSSHVLFNLLPPAKTHSHYLRTRVHNLSLPVNSSSQSRNFIYRMMFKDVY